MTATPPPATNAGTPTIDEMVGRYRRRGTWWYRRLSPPLPLVMNAHEVPLPAAEGRPGLLVGSAGRAAPPGFLGLDIVGGPGVHVVADAARLPFGDEAFTRIECDAVLEHVPRPAVVVAELSRVLAPGGYLHVVVPFNHPYHGYPGDYHRWTLDGLAELVDGFEIVASGVRTGPAAAWLLATLQLVKIVIPGTPGKIAGAIAGWLLWPLRYLDRWLLRTGRAAIMANSIYVLVRRPA